MNTNAFPISVVKYDAVIRLLCDQTQLTHSQIAQQCKVALATVERIWDGSISRPSVVVLDRLASPRRCPECGALCRDWPCVYCEMGRRRRNGPASETRFQYRNQNK